jgi:hypothetical protein
VSEQTPIVSEQSPSVVSEQTPVVSEQSTPIVSEQTPIVSDEDGPPRMIYHVVFHQPLRPDGCCVVCDRPYDDGRCRLLDIETAPPEMIARLGVYGMVTIDCFGIATGDVRPCPCGAVPPGRCE